MSFTAHTMKALLFASLALVLCQPLRAAVPGADGLKSLIINEFDTNSDGLIDAGEWQYGLRESFSHLDSNGDGSITAAELDSLKDEISKHANDFTGILVAALVKQIVMSLDADNDMAVSLKEYTDRSASFFEKLDADHNGSLTAAELANLPAKLIGK